MDNLELENEVDLSILDRLTTEGLMKMQERITEVLASRLDTTLRAGRLATFKGSDGVTRTIRIVRVNGKSVSGNETGSSLKPGAAWRVSKNMITVVPEARSTPLPTRPATPHRPTGISDAW